MMSDHVRKGHIHKASRLGEDTDTCKQARRGHNHMENSLEENTSIWKAS